MSCRNSDPMASQQLFAYACIQPSMYLTPYHPDHATTSRALLHLQSHLISSSPANPAPNFNDCIVIIGHTSHNDIGAPELAQTGQAALVKVALTRQTRPIQPTIGQQLISCSKFIIALEKKKVDGTKLLSDPSDAPFFPSPLFSLLSFFFLLFTICQKSQQSNRTLCKTTHHLNPIYHLECLVPRLYIFDLPFLNPPL
ncbi:hypothetical protein V8C40DRAFT_113744 [Trichoderma camerunense]